MFISTLRVCRLTAFNAEVAEVTNAEDEESQSALRIL
jgi:hypothetical protein